MFTHVQYEIPPHPQFNMGGKPLVLYLSTRQWGDRQLLWLWLLSQGCSSAASCSFGACSPLPVFTVASGLPSSSASSCACSQPVPPHPGSFIGLRAPGVPCPIPRWSEEWCATAPLYYILYPYIYLTLMSCQFLRLNSFVPCPETFPALERKYLSPLVCQEGSKLTHDSSGSVRNRAQFSYFRALATGPHGYSFCFL